MLAPAPTEGSTAGDAGAGSLTDIGGDPPTAPFPGGPLQGPPPEEPAPPPAPPAEPASPTVPSPTDRGTPPETAPTNEPDDDASRDAGG